MIASVLENVFFGGITASVVIGLFLAIVFFRQKTENKRLNVILGLLLTVFSISVVLNSFLNVFIPQAYPNVWTFPEPFLLLIGPLFYIYIRSLSGTFSYRKKTLLHFLPFLIVGVCFIAFITYNEQSVPEKINLRYIRALPWSAVYFHFWVYYFLNQSELKRYKEKLKQSLSSIEKVLQSWITYCMITLLSCYTILGLLFILGHGVIRLPINQSLSVVIAIIIYSIGFRTFSGQKLFAGITELVEEADQVGGENLDGKYKKSSLSDNMVFEELDKVKRFMSSHKPYLDADLDLLRLAKLLQLSSHHLSQIINEGSQTNFYEFVNSYRVEEAKELLTSSANEHLTVLRLALDSGFNSKSTFNRLFKQATRQTPSEFRIAHRIKGNDPV